MTGEPPLRVMTVNVRRPIPEWATRRADRWSVRAPRLAALLAETRPDLVCAQEVTSEIEPVMRDALGPAYESVGTGRSRVGDGEACPIFFDAARFTLLETRQTALSPAPEVAGSRGWGSPFPRVLVEATLEDRASGRVVSVLNTHLDVLSARARRRSARLIRERVMNLVHPTIVAGDMNATADSAPIEELLRDGHLRDAWAIARHRASPEWDTYARYRTPRAGGRRLDWILVSRELAVREITIEARSFRGGRASDHLPVLATVEVTP